VLEAGELILDRQSFLDSFSGHLVVILGNRRLLYGSSAERAPSLVKDGEFTTPVVPDELGEMKPRDEVVGVLRDGHDASVPVEDLLLVRRWHHQLATGRRRQPRTAQKVVFLVGTRGLEAEVTSEARLGRSSVA
jgi:hypothetical protein